ncbi:unnamed protein product [Cuscuta epithymum]|uniref:Uncharacterized protein n=1 Tax=Cuscuta epithymum TaxID=186058 RepID=A0AAV0C3I1_9ASTE|nr:unnamed protein product [Cuscuta epithymum]
MLKVQRLERVKEESILQRRWFRISYKLQNCSQQKASSVLPAIIDDLDHEDGSVGDELGAGQFMKLRILKFGRYWEGRGAKMRKKKKELKPTSSCQDLPNYITEECELRVGRKIEENQNEFSRG